MAAITRRLAIAQEGTLARKKLADALTGLGFIAPVAIIFTIFLIIPIAFALFISLTDWNGVTPLDQQLAPATGVVEFTNRTGETLVVPAGTVVSSTGSKAVSFRTREEISIPPNSTVTDVPIEALPEFAGRQSNVRAGQITVVEGVLAESLSVNNASPTEGGKDQAYNIIGLENYNNLLFKQGIRQKDFYTALKNTVYYVLGVVPTQTILALILAVIVNQRWLKAKGFFRTAFYFPSISSSVVISLIFMWMFTRGGIVNQTLGSLFPDYQYVTWLEDSNGIIHNILGLLGITRQTAGDWASTRVASLTLWEWISGPSVTMFMIMVLNTWTTIGTMMVIYLAALQNIPSQVYEAAVVDGATSWQIFRKITVPLLAPTTFFVVTLGLIGTFQVFDQVAVISSGGPAKTTLTIAYIVYENGFNNQDMGLASATAIVLFFIIFIFTMIQRRFTSERVDY